MPPIPEENQFRGQERLALHAADCLRMDTTLLSLFLAGRVQKIRVEEDVLLEFVGDLEQAAMACDCLRSEDRLAGRTPTRVYLKRRKWSQLPANAVLTRVESGGCTLNEEYFRPSPARGTGPAPQPVTWPTSAS